MPVDETTKRLQQAINDVIMQQIEENKPPQTRETLQRLMAEGFKEKEALQLIGHVVAKEVFSVVNEGKSYDEKRYVEKLQRLPDLPWQEGPYH